MFVSESAAIVVGWYRSKRNHHSPNRIGDRSQNEVCALSVLGGHEVSATAGNYSRAAAVEICTHALSATIARKRSAARSCYGVITPWSCQQQ